jgi:hypothetical protein
MCVNAFFRANYSATAPIWLTLGLRPDLNWRIAEDEGALTTLHMAEALLPLDLRRIIMGYVRPGPVAWYMTVSTSEECFRTLHSIYTPLAWWFYSDFDFGRPLVAIPYGSRWVSISSRDI